MTNNEIHRLRLAIELRVMELEASDFRRDAIVIEGSADELDRRLLAADREAAVRDLENAFHKRREARAALGRIDEGNYGICVECEQAIAPARLAALPWAALCLHCQKAADADSEQRYSGALLPMAA